MFPIYALVTLSVLSGIIFLYFICLKLSTNDWVGNVPPGPVHLPLIGCLLNFLKISGIKRFCENLFLVYGNVVKYCVLRNTIVIIRSEHQLENVLAENLVEENTHLFVIRMLTSLGFCIPKSKLFLEKCARIGKSIYNSPISNKEFRMLMDVCENYRNVQHEIKVQKLFHNLTHNDISLDETEKRTIAECRREIEACASWLEMSPQMILPGANLWPINVLRRKKMYKSFLLVQAQLKKIIVKATPCEEISNLFFIFYVMMSLSKTTPKRGTPLKQHINLDVCPDGMMSAAAEAAYQFSFDVCGLRFFKAMDYIKVEDFNIPTQSLIVSYSNQTMK